MLIHKVTRRQIQKNHEVLVDAREIDGLPPEANDACQAIVEAIQCLPGVQQRIFDAMRGRDHDCEPQEMWDALLKEIY